MARKTAWRHSIHVHMAEIYALIPQYYAEIYRDTAVLEILLLFYIGFALLLAFAFFQLSWRYADADSRVSALTLIRLSITVNTMPGFITAFVKARKQEIGGMGRRGLVFDAISVYYAKLLVFLSVRILLFIPFTAIVYPIIGFRAGFNRVLVFFLTLVLQQAAATSLGLLVSASCVDPTIAGLVISTISLITFLFSGSIAPRLIIPRPLRWLEFLSISFYAHQALLKNELQGAVFVGGQGGSGDEYVRSLNLDVLGIWPALGALLGITLLINIAGPIALTFTSRKVK